MTVSILTLNLWGIKGPYEKRKKLIKEGIKSLEPDIIGFQETYKWRNIYQVTDFLDRNEYNVIFGPALKESIDQEYGNTIASKWPIKESCVIKLPNAKNAEKRIALWALLESSYGMLPFICTHLNMEADRVGIRKQQIMKICNFIIEKKKHIHLPTVLVGDFNSEPDSSEIALLVNSPQKSIHFQDSWKANDSYGYTISKTNKYARKTFNRNKRIDYIFLELQNDNLDILRLIKSCRVVFNYEKKGIWPSDHFGVLAEIFI